MVRPGKRVVADDGDVIGDDLAVLNREDVEGAVELGAGQDQRHGQPDSRQRCTAGAQALRSGKVTSSTSASVCNS